MLQPACSLTLRWIPHSAFAQPSRSFNLFLFPLFPGAGHMYYVSRPWYLASGWGWPVGTPTGDWRDSRDTLLPEGCTCLPGNVHDLPEVHGRAHGGTAVAVSSTPCYFYFVYFYFICFLLNLLGSSSGPTFMKPSWINWTFGKILFLLTHSTNNLTPYFEPSSLRLPSSF